eukprot:TRINITY_DN2851_c0_g2_i1.p1 TRINITY_DN2851_c0_g2~~TRINITY_DN2851_c0_g2_i1.p1  ORF type:complete len:364 (-),score=101.83 TRINITY_DN2851_c0_g2_i1:460-1551(-)
MGDAARMEELGREIQELKNTLQQRTEDLFDSDHTSLFEYAESVANYNTAQFQLKVKRTLKGHGSKVYSLDWAREEQVITQLVSASQDGILIIWDALTTIKVNAILLRSSWAMTCGISPTASLVASGGLDNTVTIFNISGAGDEQPPIAHEFAEDHTGFISDCYFLSDSQLISTSGDKTAILWDINNERPSQVFEGHEKDIMCCDVSPDQNTFLTGGLDTINMLWDIRQANPVMYYGGHEKDVNSIKYLPSGNAFISGSDDGSVRLTDLRIDRAFNAYSSNDMISVSSVDVSASGRFIFTAGTLGNGNNGPEGLCLVWDTLSAIVVHGIDYPSKIGDIAVSADSRALGVGNWDNSVRIYTLMSA